MLSLEQYHKAFKSYDIRGIWWKEIDANLWYYLGLGLGNYILNQTGKQATIMIWADTRQNNTQLINNTLSGLSQVGLTEFVSAGMDFENYPHGICSTAMAYQLSYQTYDYSIIFSASHNSAEYIGIKIFTKENKFIPTSKLKELFTKALAQYQAEWLTPLSDRQTTKFYQHDQNITINKKKRSDTLDDYFGQLTKSHSFAIDYGHGAAVTYEQEYINTSLIQNSKFKISLLLLMVLFQRMRLIRRDFKIMKNLHKKFKTMIKSFDLCLMEMLIGLVLY
jgi:phosphomannomutase